jgi:hypothetical protein
MTRLTAVLLQHSPKHADDWLRFGRPVHERSLDRRRRLALFAAGAVFAYVRWRGGRFGTETWRLAVLQAIGPGRGGQGVPGVAPGAEILLMCAGEGPVRCAFTAIDAVEAAGFDPDAISPDYWRAAHNRLTAHAAPRHYGATEHAAWLLRRSIVA